MTINAAAFYLIIHPRHALIIEEATDINDQVWSDRPMAVFRGTSDKRNNFYVQPLPLDDPNDANGGDLIARQAIFEAIASFSMKVSA